MVEVVGLCVILFVVIYASCSRVYPPITISARLLCNYRGNIKMCKRKRGARNCARSSYQEASTQSISAGPE